MPKRTDLESILIIGAGPIVIGQACEFDYSGAQACKALRHFLDALAPLVFRSGKPFGAQSDTDDIQFPLPLFLKKATSF